MSLQGQESSFTSGSVQISSFGASNPVAGILASQIIQQINAGAQGLAAGHTNEVQTQSAGAKPSGPSQGRA